MAERKKQQAAKRTEPQTNGGREFGNVIEPTQAQMASGNRGLAEPAQSRKKTARKKAA